MSEIQSNHHISVMMGEVIEFAPQECKVFIDFTLGRAGHSEQLIQMRKVDHLYGVDRDSEAISFSKEKLNDYPLEKSFLNLPFGLASSELLASGVKADFILADLGISSPQVDNAERGFSFRNEAVLDMRMDQRQKISAKELVNEYPAEDLARIINDFGEEKFARRIAERIVTARQKKEIRTTVELAEIVKDAVPKKFQFKKIHPATKTFQAVRIEVNSELDEIKTLMSNVLQLLKPKGRLAVISFHSLEDRIIKKSINAWLNRCDCPPNMPKCVCGKTPLVEKLHGKVLKASENEIGKNARSRSAKMRVVEKL